MEEINEIITRSKKRNMESLDVIKKAKIKYKISNIIISKT